MQGVDKAAKWKPMDAESCKEYVGLKKKSDFVKTIGWWRLHNYTHRKSWKVIKGPFVWAKGEKFGTLYLCTSNVCSNITLASTNADIVFWTWAHEWEGDADSPFKEIIAMFEES